MPIGRFSANAPWMQKVDPVAALSTGARLGTEQAKAQTSLMAQQQAVQQRAAAFPLEQRARNLASQKTMLDMATANEQRGARLDALELGNQTTAQNLVLRREETDLSWDRLNLEGRKWELASAKAKNDLFIQNQTIEDGIEQEASRGEFAKYSSELSKWRFNSDPSAKQPDPNDFNFDTITLGEAIAAGVEAADEKSKSDFGLAAKALRTDKRELEAKGYMPEGVSAFDATPSQLLAAKNKRAHSQLRGLAAENRLTPQEMMDALMPEGFVTAVDATGTVTGVDASGAAYWEHLMGSNDNLRLEEVNSMLKQAKVAKAARTLAVKTIGMTADELVVEDPITGDKTTYKKSSDWDETSARREYSRVITRLSEPGKGGYFSLDGSVLSGLFPEIQPGDVNDDTGEVYGPNARRDHANERIKHEARVAEARGGLPKYPSLAAAIRGGRTEGEAYWNITADAMQVVPAPTAPATAPAPTAPAPTAPAPTAPAPTAPAPTAPAPAAPAPTAPNLSGRATEHTPGTLAGAENSRGVYGKGRAIAGILGIPDKEYFGTFAVPRGAWRDAFGHGFEDASKLDYKSVVGAVARALREHEASGENAELPPTLFIDYVGGGSKTSKGRADAATVEGRRGNPEGRRGYGVKVDWTKLAEIRNIVTAE